jgi:hypothetical protein
MNTPKSQTNQPAIPADSEIQASLARTAANVAAANGIQAAIMHFGLQYDVPLPIDYFDEIISRSKAFSERSAGRLALEMVRSRAAVRPSELARFLRNDPQA